MARAHRVLLVALTMKDVDPIGAKGAVEHTFKQLRELRRLADPPGSRPPINAGAMGRSKDRTPFRYFWWPEFQKRGALHYHAILVDPPFQFERDARRWFDAHWRSEAGAKLAEIQTWVEYRSFDWFRRRGGDYVLKDVRKIAGKRYEQEYDRMPKGWRTCSSSRLEFAAAEHLEHETKAWTVCTADVSAPFHERRLAVYVYRVDWHAPARHGCRLYQRRTRVARPGRAEAVSHDVSGTLLLPGSAPIVSGVLGRGGEQQAESHRRASPARARLRRETLLGSRPQPAAAFRAIGTTGCVEQRFQRSLVAAAAALPGRADMQHESRSGE